MPEPARAMLWDLASRDRTARIRRPRVRNQFSFWRAICEWNGLTGSFHRRSRPRCASRSEQAGVRKTSFGTGRLRRAHGGDARRHRRHRGDVRGAAARGQRNHIPGHAGPGGSRHDVRLRRAQAVRDRAVRLSKFPRAARVRRGSRSGPEHRHRSRPTRTTDEGERARVFLSSQAAYALRN